MTASPTLRSEWLSRSESSQRPAKLLVLVAHSLGGLVSDPDQVVYGTAAGSQVYDRLQLNEVPGDHLSLLGWINLTRARPIWKDGLAREASIEEDRLPQEARPVIASRNRHVEHRPPLVIGTGPVAGLHAIEDVDGGH